MFPVHVKGYVSISFSCDFIQISDLKLTKLTGKNGSICTLMCLQVLVPFNHISYLCRCIVSCERVVRVGHEFSASEVVSTGSAKPSLLVLSPWVVSSSRCIVCPAEARTAPVLLSVPIFPGLAFPPLSTACCLLVPITSTLRSRTRRLSPCASQAPHAAQFSSQALAAIYMLITF